MNNLHPTIAAALAAFAPPADEKLNYTNYYRCPRCRHSWEDRWSCACNDQCPNCRLKDIEPYDSEVDGE